MKENWNVLIKSLPKRIPIYGSVVLKSLQVLSRDIVGVLNTFNKLLNLKHFTGFNSQNWAAFGSHRYGWVGGFVNINYSSGLDWGLKNVKVIWQSSSGEWKVQKLPLKCYGCRSKWQGDTLALRNPDRTGKPFQKGCNYFDRR